MGGFIDTTVAVLVLVVFLYLIYMRLRAKFPGMGSGMDEYFPFMRNKPKGLEKEGLLKQTQTWSEQRTKL